MTTENVQPAEQPDHFAEIAAELRKVADDIATLVGSGLPKPRQFQLNIQPGSRDDDNVTADAVDAMAGALLGIRGRVRKMSGGAYHYGVDLLPRGPIEVVVYQGVSRPWALRTDVAAAKAELIEREAELEKARARVAELERARKPLVSDETIRAAVPATWNERKERWENSDDPTGLSYSREPDADDPTPVSPARVPLRSGSVVDGVGLVADGRL